MASPTRWTWVWVDSGSRWWTGKPGVLQSMGSQREKDREAWRAAVHGVSESDMTERLTYNNSLIHQGESRDGVYCHHPQAGCSTETEASESGTSETFCADNRNGRMQPALLPARPYRTLVTTREPGRTSQGTSRMCRFQIGRAHV